MTANRCLGKMPLPVRGWLLDEEAWLVGSGVRWFLKGEGGVIRDLDVIIPPSRWLQGTRALDKRRCSVSFNTFGGLKIRFPQEMEVDVWPMHLEDYFALSYPEPREALRLQPYALIKEIAR